MKNSIQYGLKLSFTDHLRKDYKKINYQGINAEYSIIYLPTKIFIDRYWEDLEKHFIDIPAQKDHAYFLMFAYKNEKK